MKLPESAYNGAICLFAAVAVIWVILFIWCFVTGIDDLMGENQHEKNKDSSRDRVGRGTDRT